MEDPKDILDKAIDALATTDVPQGPPPELTDATVAKLAENVGNTHPETRTIKITNIIRRISSPIKIAAVILILITIGYAIGRLSAFKAPDIEQLQSALEPAIRQNLLQDMDQYMQVSLANGYTQLKDELQQQYRRDLSDFAIQTLAASSTVTNQRLQELIDAINAAQTNDRQWFTSALSQIEYNRLQDKTQLSASLKTLALQTEDQLQRTRQDMVQLLSYPKPDSIDVDKSNNQNNLNERSE